jgi:hypothetical protein
MKSIFSPHVLALAVALTTTLALAQESPSPAPARDSDETTANAPVAPRESEDQNLNSATLLVEEKPDQTSGQNIVVPLKPEVVVQAARSEKSSAKTKASRRLFKFVHAAGLSLRLPLFSIDGKLAIALNDDQLEAGVEADIGNANQGQYSKGATAYLGSYIRLAPIPGEIGKRLYLYGKVFRAYSLIKISDADANYLGTHYSRFNIAEYGIGYRHYEKDNYGGPARQYFYIELGAVKPVGDYCDYATDNCTPGNESKLFDGLNSTIGIHIGYGSR